MIELARKEFVSTKKSVGVNEVPFFGNIITDKGLKADPSKIETILKLEVPDSRKKLERFLGKVNYLSKFAPNHNEITSSLRSLLKKETEFLWDEPQSRVFERVKQTITKSPNKELTLEVDSSKDGTGACLMQENRPIAFASKSLTQAETGYAQIEKELLAILFGCKRFHQYTYGRRVTVHSDHKPISAKMRKPISAAPPRLSRILLQLQKYSIDVIHKSGKDIPVIFVALVLTGYT